MAAVREVGMERVFDRVVGLDVHKDTVVALRTRLPRGDGGADRGDRDVRDDDR